ncbi:MAG TPA: arginase family protein, partial [Chitinophagaceae bacterium]
EKHGEYGILQIDAHCDMRPAYEGFKYSHASIMYNMLQEVPQVTKLVQAGIRDYSEGEWDFLQVNKDRVTTYFIKDIAERQYEGDSWKTIAEEIVSQLPKKVYLSFDIDGLDPKLCPNTGTPVPGGFEAEQVFYLLKKVMQSGRQIIGMDLNEIGVGENDWDANVGARILFRLCNILVASNPQ